MKVTLRFKGGPGSGFTSEEGHQGIPGHQGGSRSTDAEIDQIDRELAEANSRKKRVAPVKAGAKKTIKVNSTPFKSGKEIDESKPIRPQLNTPKVVVLEKVLESLSTDEKMRNIVIGLMADGAFPDIMNVTTSFDENYDIGDWQDPDSVNSIARNIKKLVPELSEKAQKTMGMLDKGFNEARYSKGWNYGAGEKRKAWEMKYYGQTFEDPESDAEMFGIEKLDAYIKRNS